MILGPEHAKTWLTIKEAAALLHRAPSNIYRWIDKGYLKAYDAPGRLSFMVRSDELLAAQQKAKRHGKGYIKR